MEHTKFAKRLRAAAPLAAVLLAAFRVLTLKSALDENGLLPRGSLFLPLTILLSACVFGGLWALSAGLNRLPGRESCFSRRPVWMFLRLAAAIAVFFGALLVFLDGRAEPDRAEKLIVWGGMASGLAMAWTATDQNRGPWVFWLRLLPSVYTVAALIQRFRTWSHDPLVIHFAPLLLAWTCCMVEMMLLSGFSLGAGHRRSGVLFGLAAGVFACMALPDQLLGLRSGLPELLTILGLALWCAVSGFDLLRDRPQSEQPPAEPEPEPEPETEADTEAQDPA